MWSVVVRDDWRSGVTVHGPFYTEAAARDFQTAATEDNDVMTIISPMQRPLLDGVGESRSTLNAW
jgi:hypothetical protein